MTLRDIYQLCERFVPALSRHPNSFSFREGWWPAHEVGHLLTVEPASIGLVMFGLDDDADPNALQTFERRCRELAAMRISYRLLVAAGRQDLADQEVEDTDRDTLILGWEGPAKRRVNAILRERRTLRVPRTREALEAKCRRVLAEYERITHER